MTEPAPTDPAQPRGILLCLLPWMLGLGTGAAFLATQASSVATIALMVKSLTVPTNAAGPTAFADTTIAAGAAIVLAWYTGESTRWLIAALRPPNREIAVVYLLPRTISTPLGLAAAHLLNLSRSESILVAFVAVIALESLARLGMRRFAPSTVRRANACVEIPHGERKTRMGLARAIGSAVAALLFALVFSLTSWAWVVRETLFDPRALTHSLYNSGFYPALVAYAGDAALDAARQQRGDARWVAELLTEDDLRLIKEWGLPEPWTTAWLQESLAAALTWVEAPGSQRVPPISIPLSDIERHAKDAASLLLDRHLAAIPACTPDTAPGVYCRPPDMSVQAYIATYKPPNMGIADEILDRVPAELDLSTAIALFGGPLREPLKNLDRVRTAIWTLNWRLALSGLLCLVPLASLWLLCSVTHKSRLRWIGAALLMAALGVWAASYAALSLLPQRLSTPENAALPVQLSVPLRDLIFVVLAAVHARISTWAVVSAAVALLLIWVPLLAPHTEAWARPVPPAHTVRTGVVILAILASLWILYTRGGARLYAQASQLYHDMDVAKANTLYRQIDRLYPFRVASLAGDSIVERARRDQYKTQLYLDAQAAYDAAEWQTAAQHYEALLLTQPTLKLRDSAEAHLAEALVRWARLLEADGQRERALDRYRYLRDEGLGRGRQLDGEPIRTHWLIGTLYLDWGDEQLSQDPEAALATYRRALSDTDDPGVWMLAEERMVGAYCAWNTQLRQAGDESRAARVCTELGIEFPALASDPCAACTP